MAQVVLLPGWQVFDENGNPAAGAKASFFLAGTSTPVNVFSDSTLVTPHAVPVVADSEGRFPTIYAAAGDYKIKVTNSADVDLFPEVDNWTVLTNLTQTILSFPTVTKTTDYTVLAADRGKVLEFDAAGATLIVTLEAATLGAGFPIWIVNSGATGTVRLEFDGGETLLDLTSYSLTDTHQAVGITSRGAVGWRLIAAVTLERMATIASAATITLGDGGYSIVTGTTGITDIDFTNDIAGHSAWVKFSGILQLTNSGTLILPSGVNITTAAGDTAKFASEGSDVVRCLSYNRASGAPLFGGVTDVQTFTADGTWTKPSGGTLVLVRIWGPGASGGKGSATRPGGGGGGGGYTEKWLLMTECGATETVTLPAGGVAQTTANTVGNPGAGNSTFGALVTAYPGGAGFGSSSANGSGGGGGGGTMGPGAAGFVGGAAGVPDGGGSGGDAIGFVSQAGSTVAMGQGGIVNASPHNSLMSRGGYGNSTSGGGGGAGIPDATEGGGPGGKSVNGGGGGGGGAADAAPGPGIGGTSVTGGVGGAGAFDASNATDGTVPSGGGGGSETGNSGAGAKGMCIVYVFV